MIELVSRSEMAKRLRVSPGRLRTWTSDPAKAFPEPVARSGTTQLWEWDVVARWAGGDVPGPEAPQSSGSPPANSTTATEPSLAAPGVEWILNPADSFVGREQDMVDLDSLVADHPFVTLTGAPGVGKTRLAGEFARSRVECWRDGVRFVSLAALEDPDHLLPAIALGIDVPDRAAGLLLDRVRNFVARRQLLVILDNCEHHCDAVAQLLPEVFGQAPELRVLVTSRSCLGMEGEVVKVVRELPVGSPWQPGPAEHLFWDRAGAHLARDEPTAKAVNYICGHLDGLPLAIEMGALWTKVLSAPEIAARLSDRLRLLGGGTRAISNYDTLRGAIEWSYELLSEREQALLRRMSVFSNRCALDALDSVCTGPDLLFDDLLDTLASLVAKSLVVAETHQTPARYRLLESIREYAQDRLDASGESFETSIRYRQWCQLLVAAAEPQLTSTDQAGWFDRLEGSLDDIRRVLRGLLNEGAGVEVLRMASAMTLYWRLRFHVQEGRDWLAQGMVAAGAATTEGLAPNGSIGALNFQLPTDRVPVDLSTKVLFGLGLLGCLVGDVDNGIKALGASRAMAQQCGDPVAEARALMCLGGFTASSRDRDAGLAHLERAEELAKRAADHWSLARAVVIAAEVRLEGGEVPQAEEGFTKCLRIAKRTGDLEAAGMGLIGLGSIHLERGELHRADGCLTEGLAISQRLRDSRSIGNALGFLGAVAWKTGRLAAAKDCIGAAFSLHSDLRWRVDMIVDLIRLADVLLSEGEVDQAAKYLQDASSMASAADMRVFSLEISLGRLALARGEYTAAHALLSGVVSEVKGSRRNQLAADLTLLRAQLAEQEGDARRASSNYYEALDMRQQSGDRYGVVECIEHLAQLFVHMGRHEPAARLLGAADGFRKSHGYARYPVNEPRYQADVVTVRKKLGRARFEAGWAEGSTLSVEEAVAYASRGQGRRSRHRPPTGWSSLTTAEQNVIALVTEGLTNAQIAERLFVSVRTVESHLYGVFHKLGISSRTELAKLAFERDSEVGPSDAGPGRNGNGSSKASG